MTCYSERSPEIILCTLGTRGDLLPFLLLGRRLRDEGWPVTLLSNANWRDEAIRAGLSFVSIAEEDRTQSGRNDYRFFVDDVIPAQDAALTYFRERTTRGSRMILLYRSNMLGAECAAQLFNIPRIRVILQPSAIRSHKSPPWPLSGLGTSLPEPIRHRIIATLYTMDAWRNPYARHTRRFRRSLGLPAKVAWRKACSDDAAVILFSSRWFSMPQSDWPSNLYLTGFPVPREETIDPETRSFVETLGPPIVCTPGTGVTNSVGFFRRAATIAANLKRSAVFLSPHIPDEFRGQPNILCRDYLPLGGLLRSASALMHHGGIGTIAEAFRAGCPQIIFPDRFDQPDNAIRVAQLGLGAAIMSDNLPNSQLCDLVREVLKSQHISSQLTTARELMASEDGVANAIEIVEDVAERHIRSS